MDKVSSATSRQYYLDVAVDWTSPRAGVYPRKETRGAAPQRFVTMPYKRYARKKRVYKRKPVYKKRYARKKVYRRRR